MTPTSCRSQAQGFTFIELMVVLAIASAVLSVVVVSVGSYAQNAQRRLAGDQVDSLVRSAARLALHKMCLTRLVVDTDKRQLNLSVCGVPHKVFVLPDGISVKVVSPVGFADTLSQDPASSHWFSPKGDQPGLVLELTQGDRVFKTVDARTVFAHKDATP